MRSVTELPDGMSLEDRQTAIMLVGTADIGTAITPQERLAAHMACQHLRHDADKGSAYKDISDVRLLQMLRQNVDEIELALKYDNDVADKVADAGNYLAYLLDNYLRRP